jgi:hypothetical protein
MELPKDIINLIPYHMNNFNDVIHYHQISKCMYYIYLDDNYLVGLINTIIENDVNRHLYEKTKDVKYYIRHHTIKEIKNIILFKGEIHNKLPSFDSIQIYNDFCNRNDIGKYFPGMSDISFHFFCILLSKYIYVKYNWNLICHSYGGNEINIKNVHKQQCYFQLKY